MLMGMIGLTAYRYKRTTFYLKVLSLPIVTECAQVWKWRVNIFLTRNFPMREIITTHKTPESLNLNLRKFKKCNYHVLL
jgi:hypothetical protein